MNLVQILNKLGKHANKCEITWIDREHYSPTGWDIMRIDNVLFGEFQYKHLVGNHSGYVNTGELDEGSDYESFELTALAVYQTVFGVKVVITTEAQVE